MVVLIKAETSLLVLLGSMSANTCSVRDGFSVAAMSSRGKFVI